MTNNPSFSNPNPSLTEITTAVDELTQAFALDQAAKSEVSTRVVTQENAEARLDQGLTKLAAYVESVAGKDDSLRIKYPVVYSSIRRRSIFHSYRKGRTDR